MNTPLKGNYKAFSSRLIAAMKQAGYNDSRSPSGISISTLSAAMNVSDQICRRYLRGDALPDYEKVIKLSNFLAISPGWLLFGDQNDVLSSENEVVRIDSKLLHYILQRSHALYILTPDSAADFPDFVLDLIKDISAIDANGETLQKIIDLAVSSILSFEEKKIKHDSSPSVNLKFK